ncbi:phosphotransferase family protein [Paenibacillus koleovorans]|uniref:phosphotransferase family protein n=1 Tax=Paenibacillus koleovorans TaxID=121608 RepID=UPI0013E29ADF|nr:phosphotransferase [Paenibacillus koleovorans]
MTASLEQACLRRLTEDHPELAGKPIRVVSSGHQNVVVVVDETYVFRFPRTEDLSSLRLEQRLLPKLGEVLPVGIPQFEFASGPKEKPVYVGYPILRGKTLERSVLESFSDATQLRLAQGIAGFLSALHQFQDDELVQCTNRDRRACRAEWRRNWSGYYRAVEQIVFPRLHTRERTWIMEVFHAYLYPEEHFEFRPCLIHGDFKNDHILVNAQGRMTGVIDFGQLKIGDPSYDYHDLYLTYGEPFAELVYKLYTGPHDPTFLSRCKQFYTHIIRFSSLINSIQSGDKAKFERRLEWLRKMARGSEAER